MSTVTQSSNPESDSRNCDNQRYDCCNGGWNYHPQYHIENSEDQSAEPPSHSCNFCFAAKFHYFHYIHFNHHVWELVPKACFCPSAYKSSSGGLEIIAFLEPLCRVTHCEIVPKDAVSRKGNRSKIPRKQLLKNAILKDIGQEVDVRGSFPLCDNRQLFIAISSLIRAGRHEMALAILDNELGGGC